MFNAENTAISIVFALDHITPSGKNVGRVANGMLINEDEKDLSPVLLSTN